MASNDLQEQLRLALQRAESAERRLALQRAENAERRFENERKRTEDANQRVKVERKRTEDAKQRVEVERECTRETTLTEYLDLCHGHLFKTISIETNKRLTTQIDITNPKGKHRPNRLCPWNEFLTTQKVTQERFQAAYIGYDGERVFENRDFIEGYGRRVASRKLASETDLAHLQRNTVETAVTSVITHLQSLNSVRDEFNVRDGISFDNHPNALSNAEEEVSQRLENLQPSTPPHSVHSFSGLKADQICVYTATQDHNTLRKLAFVVEYKAPHKLSLASLRFGLREMDLKSVIDCNLVPPAEIDGVKNPEHFRYHADRLVASVITQTFSYMIQGGTQYGYITTGEAFVFLHVRLDDPTTVYYHLTEPELDVIAQKNANQEFTHRTAVSQILAFSLLALESGSGDQKWRENALSILDVWEVDYENILHSIPATVRKSPPNSDYFPKVYTPGPKSKMRLRSMNTCRDNTILPDDNNLDPSDTSDQESPSDTPARSRPRESTSQNQTPPSKRAKTSHYGTQRRPFCTRRCLHGLARETELDMSCPNVPEHCGASWESDHHRINNLTFLTLLRHQLQLNRDDNCYPLGIQGARGALFKITLASYGYTVAAKGTVAAFMKDLQHERQVYQRLRGIQGVYVPVCLGDIDLVHPYYYDIGVQIVHMMFLSWAGERLDKSKIVKDMDRKRLGTMVTQSLGMIHGMGVLHVDARIPNMLWNEEEKRVVLIDFERWKIMSDFQQLQLAEEQALGEKSNKDITNSKSQVNLQFLAETSAAQRLIAQHVGLVCGAQYALYWLVWRGWVLMTNNILEHFFVLLGGTQ